MLSQAPSSISDCKFPFLSRTLAGQATALLSSIRSVLGPSALPLTITSSCSLQHLPYNVALETSMEPGLKARLGFAVQKLKVGGWAIWDLSRSLWVP